MPELPEVETYRRYLERHAMDQAIDRIEVRDERILAVRRETLTRHVRKQKLTATRRHGKHLFAAVGDRWLRFHFGMSGDLAYYRDPAEEPRHARVVFRFENGASLAFDDQRLFGAVDLVRDVDAFIERVRLGPDPLDPSFRFEDFRRLLEGRRGAVKSLLMSQDVIAGLGNLYVDEILYHCGIRPRRAVDRLREREMRALYTAMRKILRDAISRGENGRDLPARHLIHHREGGERCPKCGGTIRRTVVFGRTTYYCATHQR